MRVFILLSLLAVCLAERVRYDGYQVWQVHVNTPEEARLLMKMEDQGLIDIEGSIKRGVISIAVAPKFVRMLATTFLKKNMAYTTVVDNLQDLIDEEWRRLDARRNDAGVLAYDPNDFNTLDDNYNYMMGLSDNSCPSGLTCTYDNAGNSYEGRPIYIFKLSSGGTKPIVWIDSTIHAREWLATTTNVLIYSNLISTYGTDTTVTDLLNTYDFWILPIGNPDGYQYTWDAERLWRKNRRPIGTCTGVDLNRNFNYNWGLQGVSDVPCSEVYCGPSPASEVETQAYQNAIDSIASSMFTLITLHSYGEMWMFPWGNTEDFTSDTPCVIPTDYDDLFAAAGAAADGIASVSNVMWAYGTSCEVIYATTGATDDYTKGAAGVKYAFNPELRGNSFIVPANQIQPSFQEVWAGTVNMIYEIQNTEGPNFPFTKQ